VAANSLQFNRARASVEGLLLGRAGCQPEVVGSLPTTFPNFIPALFDRVSFQFFQRNEFQRGGVCRFKIDRGGTVVIKCAFPSRHAHAPFVARFQPREAPFRTRRDQIVSVEHRKIEKFLRNFRADSMQPNVFRPGPTKAVAIKARDRIAAATFEFGSQDICRHGAILPLEVKFVKSGLSGNMGGSAARSSRMKKIAIAYWLIPAQPARSFFESMIVDLARQYNAPVFEPHMTIYVGSDRAEVAAEVITKAVDGCKPIEVELLDVDHSGEFIKTLFVRSALNRRLQRLNEMIRNAAQDSSEYQLKPHLSLLYKQMSVPARHQLTRSIKLPFSEVIFDSIKAVRCASPTRNRADVEAWRVVATQALGK
jgi:Cyclic phosphodiesterase-like protein